MMRKHTLNSPPPGPTFFRHLQVRKERDVLQERMAIAEGEVEKASSLHRRVVRRAAQEAKQVRSWKREGRAFGEKNGKVGHWVNKNGKVGHWVKMAAACA